LCWYKAHLYNVNLEDNKRKASSIPSENDPISTLEILIGIPDESMKIKHPSLFIAATKDYITSPEMSKSYLDRFGTQVTTVEFDTGHWVHHQRPKEVNEAIDKWLLSAGIVG